MPLIETIVKSSLPGVELLLKRAIERNRASKDFTIAGLPDIEEGLRKHLAWVVQWCGDISIKEMECPRNLEDLHVSLELITNRRKSERWTLLNLITASPCCLVLGPLGAGKTTTVKAIAHHLLTEPCTADDERYAFPLVVQCRDMGRRETISQYLLSSLRIAVQVREPRGDQAELDREAQQLREDLVAQLVSELGALLLIDGFDELKNVSREYNRELENLAGLTGNTGVLVTCRSGGSQVSLSGFDVFTIQKFTPEQLRSYALQFFKSETIAERFLVALRLRPYASLAYTPLHAANLCRVFQVEDDLPPDNIRVYHKIVQIRSRDWDLERGVERPSQFPDFGAEQKRKLLAAIAFDLAKAGQALLFTSHAFETAYDSNCGVFGLPAGRGASALSEIESHTGLVQRGPKGQFEFYHKSIQEYLCGDHLSRVPAIISQWRFLVGMPDACALATLLSGSPDAFFYALWTRVFDSSSKDDAIFGEPRTQRFQFANVYLGRVIEESGRFRGDICVGIVLLRGAERLFDSRRAHDDEYDVNLKNFRDTLGVFCSLPGVSEAIRAALLHYRRDGQKSEYNARWVRLRQRVKSVDSTSSGNIWIPETVTIAPKVLIALMDHGRLGDS